MSRPEHREVGFECSECGENFATPLGYDRHRSRCDGGSQL